jgi:hypothetical protein
MRTSSMIVYKLFLNDLTVRYFNVCFYLYAFINFKISN